MPGPASGRRARRKVPPSTPTDPMPLWNQYFLPHSIEEALRVLSTHPAPAHLIAGGTDLLLDIQQGRHPPVDALVDVTRIPELNALEVRNGYLFVGAAVPLKHIASSELVARHASALLEAAGQVGGPQVRAMATLGGNVGHALPAADGSIALLALDAEAEIASLEGTRRAPLSSLFLGPGRSALDGRRELIVGFYVRLAEPGQASAFVRVMRPQGVALPILNLAVWLQREGERLSDVRIAIGPSGPTPQRALEAEAVLRGQRLTEEVRARALEEILTHLRFRTSPHRSTSAYRRHLAAVLLEEGLSQAWKRAAGEKQFSIGELPGTVLAVEDIQ